MFGFLKKKKQTVAAEHGSGLLNIYDELGLMIELREKDDDGPLYILGKYEKSFPKLAGSQIKVRLVNAPNGITMTREDGSPIEDRRSLSQEELRKVPKDAEACHFVNLTLPSGEIYSCIIAEPDTQVFGSMRAFWWSLAKMRMEHLSMTLDRVKLTQNAFARVFACARGMWEIVIEESGSIDNLRDQIVPLRNVHLKVITQLQEKSESKSEKLGYDIALAMVLASQSEDERLEGEVFRRLKEFFWQPGEEPKEFYKYLDSANDRT